MLDYRALQQGAPQSTQDWLQKMQRGQYIAPLLAECPSPPRIDREQASTPQAAPSQLLARMVMHPRNQPAVVFRFIQAAGHLGQRTAHVLWEDGVRVAIVPRGEPPSALVLPNGKALCEKGGRADAAGGFYDDRTRLVVVKEAYLKRRIVVHELAHALDSALTRRCRLDEPLSTILWHGFTETRKILADGYMLQGPHEYFAVSLEIYQSPRGRARLSRIDPKLLEFLDGFLN